MFYWVVLLFLSVCVCSCVSVFSCGPTYLRQIMTRGSKSQDLKAALTMSLEAINMVDTEVFQVAIVPKIVVAG